MNFHQLNIQSSNGVYTLEFIDDALNRIRNSASIDEFFFLIDEVIWDLYPDIRDFVEIAKARYLLINATEESKSYGKIEVLLNQLLDHSFKRGQKLVAIGGGITQDIVGFTASIIHRGVPWLFIPTSLLSQADSCIGSKTSINLGQRKNALGTFHHPDSIYLDLKYLESLTISEIKSGIGEIIKVHIIDSVNSFEQIAKDYDALFVDKLVMQKTIYNSLKIKRDIIERDEKDSGIRLLMNYGHTFGHAIEVATQFSIPHGLAVTLGMDTANFISSKLDSRAKYYFEKFHPLLMKNLNVVQKVHFSRKDYLSALLNDKKNTSKMRKYILLDSNGSPKLISTSLDSSIPLDSCDYIEKFFELC